VCAGVPLATMPAGLSFGEAAAVCDGGILALTCLRWARLESGQDILVYGAWGAIGTAAVQLAKHIGAHVTAVCDTRKVATVRGLGADRVVDYMREDFTATRRPLRRRLRCRRQDVVPALPAPRPARRALRRDRPGLPMAERPAGAADVAARTQTRARPDPEVSARRRSSS
jgi:NADPH:quinone reductase-like Zn-dependent oxidoreductase